MPGWTWPISSYLFLLQSLNSPFIPPHVGAKPGRAKEESRITCMGMLRTNQSKITRSQSVTGSNVFSGGSLCLNRTQGCRKTHPEYLFHTNAVIPRKTSQQAHARLVTTLGLPSLWYKHGLLPNIRVTSLLQLNKHDVRRYFTKPPSFSHDLCHTSVNATDTRDSL